MMLKAQVKWTMQSIVLLALLTPGNAVYPFPSDCYRAISLSLPNKVFYQNHTKFEASMAYYWAAQETENIPSCIMIPENRGDLKKVMQSIVTWDYADPGNCYFAVRSGGLGQNHNSNQPNGINIDLSGWKSVSISEDRKIARIGPGATWMEAYMALDALGLTVAGARAGAVGTGGYSLGGGISYASPQMGFGSDTVFNFEVLLSSGDIVNANSTFHQDLFRALKGGQNNFGIVTRVDMQTLELPQGRMWGGTVYQNISSIANQLETLHAFVNDRDYDQKSSVIQSYGTNGQISLVLNNLAYMEPTPDLPQTLRQFVDIERPLQSTVRLSNLTEFVTEMSNSSPKGLRQMTLTTTFRPTLSVLNTTYSIWMASTSLLATIQNLSYSLSFEPIPVSVLAQSELHGPNVLDLPQSLGPLIIALLSTTWHSPADDALARKLSIETMESIENASKQASTWHPYKYIGYADRSQQVLEGYGNENVQFLKTVSRRYDPQGVFQRLVKGGFKLGNGT